MYFPIIDVLKENFIAKIPSIVTQWLTDNVDPVGSAVVVDESLSISGAAADAKVTGDEISNLKSDLDYLAYEKNTITSTTRAYINTKVNTGETVDITPVANTSFEYIIQSCNKGDRFMITGRGGDASRLWAFTDTSYRLISNSANGASATDLVLIAPESGYLICNAMSPYSPSFNMLTPVPVQDVFENVLLLEGRVDSIDNTLYEYFGYQEVEFAHQEGKKAINNEGHIYTPSGTFYISEPISVKGGTEIHFKSTGATTANFAVISTCDSNGSSITPVVLTITDGVEHDYTYKTSSDGYILLGYNYSYPTKLVFISSETTKMKDAVFPFTGFCMYNTIAGVGDSYTAGAIVNSDGQWVTVPNVNYLDCIARRNGNTANNYGYGGATAGSYLSTTAFTRLLADTPSELYMIAFGINDANQSVTVGTVADIKEDYTQNPDTFYGNYGRIVAQIKEHAPNAQIILMKIWNESVTYDSYNDAIEEIAEHFSIPFITPQDDPFFTSSFWSIKSGGHPTPMQYAGMGMAIERLFAKCVVNNNLYFFYAIVG